MTSLLSTYTCQKRCANLFSSNRRTQFSFKILLHNLRCALNRKYETLRRQWPRNWECASHRSKSCAASSASYDGHIGTLRGVENGCGDGTCRNLLRQSYKIAHSLQPTRHVSAPLDFRDRKPPARSALRNGAVCSSAHPIYFLFRWRGELRAGGSRAGQEAQIHRQEAQRHAERQSKRRPFPRPQRRRGRPGEERAQADRPAAGTPGGGRCTHRTQVAAFPV